MIKIIFNEQTFYKMTNKEEYRRQYLAKKYLYENLAQKVARILEEISKENKINFHAVTSRAKDADSFYKKIQNEKYDSPFEQITDLAGVRVITYVEDEVTKICQLIKTYFKIDEPNSLDKSQELGVDRVGYKSVHYVCTMSDDRAKLPEYAPLIGLKFEIQVRTILQHSWAEIQHDKDYKFSGVLPPEIKRRFRLVAGALEILDREFNQLSVEIDNYTEVVKEKTEKGDLDIDINSESLKQYLQIKFERLIKENILEDDFNGSDNEEIVINELHNFGIQTLYDLDKITPSDLQQKYIDTNDISNYLGLLRQIMLIKDHKKYFRNSWNESWRLLGEESSAILELYEVDLESVNQYIDLA